VEQAVPDVNFAQAVRELHAAGTNDTQIAKALRVPTTRVNEMRRALGLKSHMPQSRPITGERADQLRRLHAKGLNDREIAEAMGYHKVSIYIRRNRLGLKPNPRSAASIKRNTRNSQMAIRRKHGVESVGEIFHMSSRVKAARLGWPGMDLRHALALRALERGPATIHENAERSSGLRHTVGYKRGCGYDGMKRTLGQLIRAGLVERESRLGKPAKRPFLYQLSDKAMMIVHAREASQRRGGHHTTPRDRAARMGSMREVEIA